MRSDWKHIELENLFSFVIGGDWGKDLNETNSELVEVYCIRGSEIRNWDREKGKTAVLRMIAKSSLEKRKLQEGDILVEISGGGPEQPVGRTILIDKEALDYQPEVPKVCTNFLRLVRLVDDVDKKFVNYFLAYFYKTGAIVNYQGGSNNLRNLRFTEYSRIKIPLPALPEQKRIVAKLDTLFGHLDQLKGRLEKIPTLLKQFRQAVLTQAVTGKLTEDWRKNRNESTTAYHDQFDGDSQIRDPNFDIPESWAFLPFGSVALLRSNLVNPLDYLDYPLIAPDNIEGKTGCLTSKPLVRDIMPKSPKHYFESGCIVYSKIRPYLSKLVLADFSGLCSADMYPVEARINTRYLFIYMLSEQFLDYANTAGTRTVLPKINQQELAVIPVPVPGRDEQDQIVKQVEKLIDMILSIERVYTQLTANAEQLPHAILSRAFVGDLHGKSLLAANKELEDIKHLRA